jgi:hypothetical protein
MSRSERAAARAREDRESEEENLTPSVGFTGGVAVPMNKSGRDSDGRETVSAPGSEGPKPANAEIVAAER